MANANQVDRIIHYIDILDYNEKLEVLERLVRQIRKPKQKEPENKHSLLELKGLGKEVWKRVDANDYIDHERNSWN